MTTVRVYLAGEKLGPQLKRFATKTKSKMLSSARGASQDVVDHVTPLAQQDVMSAGRFSAKWAPKGKVTEGGGFIRIAFTMSSEPPMKYWRVFEHGATIKGQPMLWIPLSFTGIKVRARDYPGKLFRVDRKSGAPLLLGGSPASPKYFGKESVTIPKKFHLEDIIKDGAKKLGLFFTQRMHSDG